MDGSNGNIQALLERIAEQLVENQASTTKAIGELAAGQERMREELVGRMDNVISFASHHYRGHEERIQVLEERVLGKPVKS